MKLAIVALPMMIALSVFASAQSVPAPARKGHVAGGIITVVKKSGTAIQSCDGGKNWQTLDTTASQDQASDIQQLIAKRQRLLAEANAATTTTTLVTVNSQVSKGDETAVTEQGSKVLAEATR